MYRQVHTKELAQGHLRLTQIDLGQLGVVNRFHYRGSLEVDAAFLGTKEW